jgi:hypothetical protein
MKTRRLGVKHPLLAPETKELHHVESERHINRLGHPQHRLAARGPSFYFSTSTPRQKATNPLIFRAAGFGSG